MQDISIRHDSKMWKAYFKKLNFAQFVSPIVCVMKKLSDNSFSKKKKKHRRRTIIVPRYAKVYGTEC